MIFTGEWSLAVKEAEATNALVDQGVDVITCHVDSPKVVVETAAGRGAFVCGYHANQSAARAREVSHRRRMELGQRLQDVSSTKLMAGEPLPNFTRGGLADGFVKMSPLGPGVSRSRRASSSTATLAEMMKGGFAVIKGPLKNNKGDVVVDRGPVLPRDGDRARKHGLSRRRRHRLDLVSAEARRS